MLVISLSLFGSYQNMNSVRESVGNSISGMAVTATLFVDVNGDSTDGSNWTKAYTTIQGALDVASILPNDCTLIMIGINTGNLWYDIATDNPTYSGNYILKGTHRNWAKIKNTNAAATSILTFTGYVGLEDLNFNLGADSTNGVVITKGAFNVDCCQFVGEDLTGLATALWIDGATTLKNGSVRNCDFLGNDSTMTALLVDNCTYSDFRDLTIHDCLTGIQIVNANSDVNTFCCIDIGDCDNVAGIAIDIDAGNEQNFDRILLHHNTRNIDDEVGDSQWQEIVGEFPVTITPDDLVGVTLTADNVLNVFGADTELIALNAIDNPFKVVITILEPQVAQWYQLRLSADSGSTWFERIMVSTSRSAGSSLPASTDFIFNKGTRISGSIKAESGGSDQMQLWIKYQEIQ